MRGARTARYRTSTILDAHERPYLIAEPAYRGGGSGRAFAGMNSGGASISAALIGQLPMLRNRVRDLLRNHPLVWKAIRTRVSNLVGTGITPRAQWRDDAKRAEVHQLWADSVPELGAEAPADFYAMQALMVRELVGPGECFLRIRRRRVTDGLVVPLQLQVLPSDFVPTWKNEQLAGGSAIKAGIQFDAIGQRVGYWMFPQHPGDYNSTATEPRFVPASEVIHLYEVIEAGQIRGEPPLARVIKLAAQAGGYSEALVQRALIAACFAGFITAPEGTDPLDDLDADDPTLEPGRMNRLDPGESITFPNMPDVGGSTEAFVRDINQQFAAGADVTYEGATGDLSRVSFSSIRAGLVEYRRQCEQVQYHTIIPALRQVWREWIVQAVVGGAIDLPAFSTPIGRREAFRVDWQPEAWPWVDPEADVAAYEKALDLGITSRRRVIVATGNDPDEIRRERRQDRDEDQADGVAASAPTAGADPGIATRQAVRATRRQSARAIAKEVARHA